MGTPGGTLGSDPSGQGWRPAPAPTEPDEQQRGKTSGLTVESAARRGETVGEARAVQMRTEQYGQNQIRNVLTFRLERHDREGNRLPPVSVEMRGLSFEGVLVDGDWVSVSGKWRDGTLTARKLRNLTSGGTLRTRSYRLLQTVVFIVIFAIALAIVLTALRLFLTLDSGVSIKRVPSRTTVRPSP